MRRAAPGRIRLSKGRRRRTLHRRLRRSPLVRLLLARPFLSRPATELTAEQQRRWWRYHRRRVLLLLLVLTAAESALGALAPGFFVGAGAGVLLTGVYLVHLRNRALADLRRRKDLAHARAMAYAHEQRLHAERRRRAGELAARRRAELAAARRAAVARQLAEAHAAAAAAHAEQDRATGTDGPSYLRGRPYQARAANF